MIWLLDEVRDYHAQWSAILAASLGLWCVFWVKPRFGAPAAALLAYAGVSAIWVWAWRDNRYLPLNPYDQMALRYFACDSLAKIMLVAVPLMLLAENRELMRRAGERAFCVLIVCNSLWIAASLFLGCYSQRNECGGLIGNPSISVGLMVCMLPLISLKRAARWGGLALVVLSVFASRSSVAAGLLATYFAFSFLPHVRRDMLVKILAMAAVGLGILALSWLALGKELINDSDRFMIWKFMMARWATPWNIPTGTGLGTYHVFSINLQEYGTKVPGSGMADNYWWNWMHNEPLQFLFECGVGGFILFAFTYLSALRSALKSSFPLAVSVILFGLYMTLDPALHSPFPSLFGAWLFVYALRQTNTLEETL